MNMIHISSFENFILTERRRFTPEVIDLNREDYDFEYKFSKNLIKGGTEISSFPYYESYERTAMEESKWIKGNGIFIGSGPFPLTNILYDKFGKIVDGLDIDKKAVSMGNKVFKHLSLDSKNFLGNAITFNDFHRYDTIILALEAGTNDNQKKRIFKNLFTKMNKKSILLVRTSNGDNSEGEFYNSNHIITDYFKEISRFEVFDGLSTTIVLKHK